MGDGCRMLLDENVFHVNSPMKPDAEISANLGIGGQAVRAGIESAYAEFCYFPSPATTLVADSGTYSQVS